MKRTKKLFLATSLLLSAASIVGMGVAHQNDLKEYVGEKADGVSLKDKKFAQIGTSETVGFSKVYTHYGETKNGKDALRFAVALTGKIYSVEFTRTIAGKEDATYKVDYLYKGLNNYKAETLYYTGEDVSTDTQYASKYYWAVFTMEFADDSTFRDAQVTVSAKVNSSSTLVATSTPTSLTAEYHKERGYGINLPTDLPDGLSLTSNLAEAHEGDQVKLTLVNSRMDELRVDKLTVAGIEIDGLPTNVKGTTLYEFEMIGQDLTVEVAYSTVYAISVKEEFQNNFALEGLHQAAAGEIVKFRPVFFAGFTAYDFVAEEADVEIKESEEAGYYEFTMPNHAVTISAAIEGVKYQVIDTTNSLYSVNVVDKKDAYQIGEDVVFSIQELSSVDATVIGAYADGIELTANEDGNYVFQMPAHEVTITAKLSYNYKTFEIEASEHYTFALTTMVGEEEVTATDHVLSNQTVYINATEKEGEENDFIVSGFTVQAKTSAEAEFKDITLTISSLEMNKFEFKTSTSYVAYKFVATEVESSFKRSPFVGSYGAGYRPYYGTNYTSSIDALGGFTMSSYKKGTLKASADHDGEYGIYYSATAANPSYLYYPSSDGTMGIYVESQTASNSNTYFFIKGQDKITCSNRTDGTYSIYKLVNSQFKGMFYSVKVGENVYTAYYDVDAHKAYFNVSITFNNDKTFSTFAKDDIAVVRDSSGNLLTGLKFTSVNSSYGDGFRHAAIDQGVDAYEGTYTYGEESYVLDGFGAVSHGEEKGTYQVLDEETHLIAMTFNDTTSYFVVDVENKTLTPDRGPKDGFEGTFTGAEGTLVLDGYGVGTLGETAITYTVEKPYVVINQKFYLLDKTNNTYTSYEEKPNPVLGNSFTGTWVDVDDSYGESYSYYYQATITFEDETNVRMVASFGYSSSDRTEYAAFDLTGTYAIQDNGDIWLTLPANKGSTSNKVLKLTKVETGYKVSEDVTIDGDNILEEAIFTLVTAE